MSKEHSSHSPGFISQALKVVFILVVAGGLCTYFIFNNVKPKRRSMKSLPSVVKVVQAASASGSISVEAMGKVEPSRKFDIISEVGGRVEWMNPKFIPGGRIAKGEVLFRIEKIDYEIALEQRKAELALAKRDLLVEEGKARYARIVEKDRKVKTTGQASELRLRVPHLQAAKADLEAAKKRLTQAEQDLERTSFHAPYNMLITEKDIELGKYVVENSVAGHAIGVNRFWVVVSIPVNKAKMINIPGVNSESGSPVKILLKSFDGEPFYRKGKVLKLLGELDENGRMARLLVGVDNPLGLNEKEYRVPLLVNAYVNVQIEGRKFSDVAVIARKNLREGNEVYVLGKESTLQVREVKIGWTRRDEVFITEGLKPGEYIITNRNFVPVEGMVLKTDREPTRQQAELDPFKAGDALKDDTKKTDNSSQGVAR